MNKSDAAALVGIGVRTLERYTKEGRVPVRYERSSSGQQVAVYETADLEALKVELAAPIYPPAVETPVGHSRQGSPGALAKVGALPFNPGQVSAIVQIVAAVDEARAGGGAKPTVPIEHKPLLTLQECQALSGLSRGILRAAIESKTLKGKQIGRAFRVKRQDLDIYLSKL